jgi:hypothetical protein
MSLKLNAPGGGSVTLQEPTTASNVTLNLPAANGTVVFENASGNVGIGTSSPNASGLTVYRATGAAISINNAATGTTGTSGFQLQGGSSGDAYIWNYSNSFIAIATNNTERARIDSSGNLLVTNVAGLGYGTGAGGTVTQATNKATAVTLNRPTGRITTSNAALAANTTVTFLLNNSLIASDDVLVLDFDVGTLASNYQIWSGGGAASRIICIRNITGSSLSDALFIRFAIIKGSTT